MGPTDTVDKGLSRTVCVSHTRVIDLFQFNGYLYVRTSEQIFVCSLTVISDGFPPSSSLQELSARISFSLSLSAFPTSLEVNVEDEEVPETTYKPKNITYT